MDSESVGRRYCSPREKGNDEDEEEDRLSGVAGEPWLSAGCVSR